MEVLWSAQAYEDLAMMNVGFAPVEEFVGKIMFFYLLMDGFKNYNNILHNIYIFFFSNLDYHWELFLWGDPPIKPI